MRIEAHGPHTVLSPHEFLSQEINPIHYKTPLHTKPTLPKLSGPHSAKCHCCCRWGRHVPLRAAGQVSARSSETISWTCSQPPPAWRGVSFPSLTNWSNTINVLLWPSFRKGGVRASTLPIYICCCQKNWKAISNSAGLSALELNTFSPRGLHSSRKNPILVRSPALYYFFSIMITLAPESFNTVQNSIQFYWHL